uniref:Thioredoxin-like fold domain-containing protein n=1 Tax=Kryptolebias marmoratus TaxID=37003 RepID=A0A3Q3GQR1_KRYMA
MSEFLLGLLGERLAHGSGAEVDVQSLGSGAGLSLLGLFFGCSLNGPCKQFSGSLRDFYGRFKEASEHRDELEVVFVSSDQDQKHWQDFVQEMPWPALPFKDRHKKSLPRLRLCSSAPIVVQLRGLVLEMRAGTCCAEAAGMYWRISGYQLLHVAAPSLCYGLVSTAHCGFFIRTCVIS